MKMEILPLCSVLANRGRRKEALCANEGRGRFMAGSETREEEEKAGGGGSSGWSTIRLRPLFFCIFFCRVSDNGLFFLGGVFLCFSSSLIVLLRYVFIVLESLHV
jgi:hypothetical protein